MNYYIKRSRSLDLSCIPRESYLARWSRETTPIDSQDAYSRSVRRSYTPVREIGDYRFVPDHRRPLTAYRARTPLGVVTTPYHTNVHYYQEEQPFRKYDLFSVRTWAYPIHKICNVHVLSYEAASLNALLQQQQRGEIEQQTELTNPFTFIVFHADNDKNGFMIEMNYHFCISLILQSWPTINSTDWLIPKECLYTTTVDYEARYLYSRDYNSSRPYSYTRIYGNTSFYTPPTMAAEARTMTTRRGYSGYTYMAAEHSYDIASRPRSLSNYHFWSSPWYWTYYGNSGLRHYNSYRPRAYTSRLSTYWTPYY
uniref:Uncharacterized protein n=1 Tax=Ascaris lumbricoides TaxID=6252 RepID=A0A9J2P2H3_ASCLU